MPTEHTCPGAIILFVAPGLAPCLEGPALLCTLSGRGDLFLSLLLLPEASSLVAGSGR